LRYFTLFWYIVSRKIWQPCASVAKRTTSAKTEKTWFVLRVQSWCFHREDDPIFHIYKSALIMILRPIFSMLAVWIFWMFVFPDATVYTFPPVPGWRDEFVKIITQNLAHSIFFVKIVLLFLCWKRHPFKLWATNINFFM
jgi:hypothetical protein